MNYANTNENNNNQCFQIDRNILEHRIDSHQINIIKSDEATTALAMKMQQKLDDVYSTALKKGYTLPQEAVMTGAIIANVGSSVVKAVALSGYQAHLLTDIIGNAFGKDVAILSENVAPNNFRALLGEFITKKVRRVAAMQQGGNIPDPSYPVGSCAAQKLLYYVIERAINSERKITQINMAEIFWKTGGSSTFSTGEPVPSCNTCKYILPMMLCNYDDLGNKIPY